MIEKLLEKEAKYRKNPPFLPTSYLVEKTKIGRRVALRKLKSLEKWGEIEKIRVLVPKFFIRKNEVVRIWVEEYAVRKKRS